MKQMLPSSPATGFAGLMVWRSLLRRPLWAIVACAAGALAGQCVFRQVSANSLPHPCLSPSGVIEAISVGWLNCPIRYTHKEAGRKGIMRFAIGRAGLLGPLASLRREDNCSVLFMPLQRG
jgi:hypothetical protein